MNLALQTRRAVITLSLLALAMACVAAKTATRHDALSAATPVRVETMAVETAQVSSQPVMINVAATTTTRCKTTITTI